MTYANRGEKERTKLRRLGICPELKWLLSRSHEDVVRCSRNCCAALLLYNNQRQGLQMQTRIKSIEPLRSAQESQRHTYLTRHGQIEMLQDVMQEKYVAERRVVCKRKRQRANARNDAQTQRVRLHHQLSSLSVCDRRLPAGLVNYDNPEWQYSTNAFREDSMCVLLGGRGVCI